MNPKPTSISTTVESPEHTRAQQSIVPDWMDKLLKQAERTQALVTVTRLVTPFSTFVLDIKVGKSPAREQIYRAQQTKKAARLYIRELERANLKPATREDPAEEFELEDAIAENDKLNEHIDNITMSLYTALGWSLDSNLEPLNPDDWVDCYNQAIEKVEDEIKSMGKK